VRNKYAGTVYDALSGLNYMQARYQNSSRGQFISEDPVFLGDPSQQNLKDPQSLNSYSYANDNPIVNADPTGRYFEISGSLVAPGRAWSAGLRFDSNGTDYFLSGAKQASLSANGTVADGLAWNCAPQHLAGKCALGHVALRPFWQPTPLRRDLQRGTSTATGRTRPAPPRCSRDHTSRSGAGGSGASAAAPPGTAGRPDSGVHSTHSTRRLSRHRQARST
jgi:RHS repeat-associated protein